MFNLTPYDILNLLAIAIMINGLWLSKCILWKSKPKARGAAVIKGQGVKVGRVADLSDLNYSDPWKRS